MADRQLSSGLGWILLAGLLVLVGAGLTMSWQHRVVAEHVERALADDLTDETASCAALVEAMGQVDLATRIRTFPTQRRLTIIAADGTVLFDSNADARSMENHNQRSEVLEARAKGHGHSVRTSGTVGTPFLYAAHLLHDGRVVRMAAPMTVEAAAVQRMTWPVVLTTSLTLLVGMAVLGAFFWRARTRVAELIGVSRAFAAGAFERRACLTGGDAIASLGHELNNLGERLHASQSQLTDQRRLLDSALGALAEGVACIDRMDQVVYANPAFLRLTTDGAPVQGQAFYRFLPAEPLAPAFTALRQGLPPPPSCELQHRLRLLSASLADGGGGIVVLVLHDLTELKRLEASRRDFLSNVSHELKTPLTAIVGFTDTLLDGALADAGVARDMVEKISRHADRLATLVRDVLTLSRLEQGAWELKPEDCDLPALLRGLLEEQRPVAVERRLSLSYQGPESATIRCDGELVRQLTGNLVSNAVRYNRPGGSVRLGLVLEKDRSLITVADTGIGIPPEHRNRIFERFYRVDAHRSRQTGGTGLGLSIVKQLVQVLGGTVEVESSEQGTTFTVRLPIRPADPLPA